MRTLLPTPAEVRMWKGFFWLSPDTRIVIDQTGSEMHVMARQLQEEVERACGVRLMIVTGQSRPMDIVLRHAPDESDAYKLMITEDSICITGETAGLRHGVQTLRQIFRCNAWKLPTLEIRDQPAFEVRGFYHDVTRGRVPTLAWLKQLADEACFYKLNQLQLYVEHTYLFADLTELHGVAVTPLTAEEILEFDEYCALRGIDLVPSLSTFGHLFELLRTQRHAHLCELENAADMPSTMPHRMAHHTIDPANPGSVKLICGMIDEYMALFRSRYFNICADETFDLGKGRNRERMAQEGEEALYIGFVRQLCGHVAEQGRIPMLWGDIVLKFPHALAELPLGKICLNWGYSADVSEDSTRILESVGATQYVCPGVSSWNRWLPHIRNSYENIRRMAEYGQQYGAAGLLNTDWGDYGHISDPRFSLPGLIIGACAAWNGELPEFDAMCQKAGLIAYGDRSGRLVSVLAELAEAPLYGWWHIVRYKDRVQGRLMDSWGAAETTAVPETEFDERQETMRAGEKVLIGWGRYVDEGARPMLPRWLNAAEASRLWDAAYHKVIQGQRDPETAQALERWLYRYEQQWREVSKESELWRIRDVTMWYAQKLR